MGSRFNQKKLEYLDLLLKKTVDEGHLLGCSFALYDKDTRIMEGAYGSDKLDSVYKIYSMTKPITAVAAMILYEKGIIDVYDPVYLYLPRYKDIMVASGEGSDETLSNPKRPILIKDLLNMTSGLVYPGEDSYAERCMIKIQKDLFKRATGGEKFTNLDIINEFTKAPLRFSPGERWKYGTSADVMAGVIEAVTGVPYGKWLKENVLDPLGMNETGFFVDPKNKDRLATMYYKDEATGLLRKTTHDEDVFLNEYAPFKPPYIESGGGGLYSTLDDYSKFALMLQNGGIVNHEIRQDASDIGKKEFENSNEASENGKYTRKLRILGEHTVKYLSSNQLNAVQFESIDFESIRGYGYGNYMRVLLDPLEAGCNCRPGEFGWDGLAGTYFFVDPVENVTFVFMQQLAQGGDDSLRRRMKQIIYGAMDGEMK